MQIKNQHKEVDIKNSNIDDIPEDKIAVIINPRDIKYLNYTYDNLGPDEVKVRITGCGIDHNDIPFWEGRKFIDYPLPGGMPGREGWGIVEKAGELTSYKKGDVVALLANNALSNIVICKHDKVIKLPKDFKDFPFPAASIGYALQVFIKADVKNGQIITVLGNGFISSLLTFLCTNAGATVLKVASFGNDAHAHFNFCWHESYKLTEAINDITTYIGCDIVIECTGTAPSCNFATSIVKEGGKLILARVTKDKVVKINMQDPCGVDIILAHHPDDAEIKQGIEKAVSLIKKGVLKHQDFISKSYRFDQLSEAFEDLCDDAGEYNKFWIKF